jgi:hypothetical protein
MFNYKERVILVSDYKDPDFGYTYRKGQTGIIGQEISENDKKTILMFDGYEEAKVQTERMWKEDGEGPNVVEYLIEIPINLLARISE